MGRTLMVIIGAVIVHVIGSDARDTCGWCARKIVRWSAGVRYADPVRARIRAEELTALISERPGSLLKLLTALAFAARAVTSHVAGAVGRRWSTTRPTAGKPAQRGPWCSLRCLPTGCRESSTTPSCRCGR